MVAQNRRGRSDLSTAAGAQTLQRLVAAGQYGDAVREFNSLARKLGRSGGGNFFQYIVRPLVFELRGSGHEKEAQDVLAEARRRMVFEPGSILAKDFDTLAAPPAAARRQ